MQRHTEATAALRAPQSVVEEILRSNPGRVLSDCDRLDRTSWRTIRTSLAVRVGSGASVAHDVAIELGVGCCSDGVVSIPLRWIPEGHERLLPEFDGELSITDSGAGRTDLTISGSYEVPLGWVGKFGDAVIGHRIARSALETLAELLARRLDEEAERLRRSISYRPAPYNEDLRPHTRHGHRAG